MAEKQYTIPQFGNDVDPELRAEIDAVIAETLETRGEILPFGEIKTIEQELEELRAHATEEVFS